MKGKILPVLAVLVLVLCLAGCSSSSTGNSSANTSSGSESAQQQSTQTATAKDFDGASYSEMDAGTFILYTPAGNSEGGAVPKVTISGISGMQIEGDTKGFDSAKVTYMFIDGMQAGKENHGWSPASLTIKGDTIKPGMHTVEAVQFSDDTTAGIVTMYHKAQYQIEQ